MPRLIAGCFGEDRKHLSYLPRGQIVSLKKYNLTNNLPFQGSLKAKELPSVQNEHYIRPYCI